MKKKLIIVDVSSFIFRAFYAIRPLHTPEGVPVNAVYGVLSMFMKLLSDHRPTHMFVAKDSKGKTFREDIYPEYKANRSDAPEELVPQFPLIKELLEKLKIPFIAEEGFEADDVIGSAVKLWHTDFDEIFIATGDKDLMQFVDEKVKILDTMKDKIYGPADVFEKMNVRPEQIVDYLSIVGDTSDNIPGMRGIGPKGASELLLKYGTLENCIAHKGEFTGKKLINAFTDHLDDAILSKKLVQIKTDLNLHYSAEELKFKFTAYPDLYEFLNRMGFKSAVMKIQEIERIESNATEHVDAGKIVGETFPLITPQQFEMKIVDKSDDFAIFIENLKTLEQVSVFFLWDSEDLFLANTLSASIKINDKIFYLPFFHQHLTLDEEVQLLDTKYLKELLDILVTKTILSVHPKQFLIFLKVLNYQVVPKVIDVIQAHFVVDPESSHRFEYIAKRYLDVNLTDATKAADLANMNLKDLSHYCGERCYYQALLWEVLKTDLKNHKLEEVFYNIDTPTIYVLAQMEFHGILLNTKYLEKLEHEFSERINQIEKEVEAISGETINLRSPKQIGTLLFEKLQLPVIKKTKTGYSTDAEVLEELEYETKHPIPTLLIEYRETDKLLSTYVKALPELVNPKTKRIHTHFNLHVAATGRLSSTNPNLQNIPIRSENGKRMRKAFIATPGKLLLTCDYSQVELRLLAHFSEDPTMLEAFNCNVDIHAQTASEVLGVKLENVTSNDRSIAKAVNFGLMYGQSSFGLARALKISRNDAKDYITKYFTRFGKVKSYLDSLKEFCEVHGHAKTFYGRKRFLPDIKSTNRTIKSMAERVAVNSPVQGTAADIIKLAMVAIDKELLDRKLKSKMLLQIHDELVFDVEEEELDVLRDLVVSRMENVVNLKVPLRVDVGIGVNLLDLK
jgi:DNA polymerase-1